MTCLCPPHQITTVWHGTLVKLLRSLYALALPAGSKELQSVEQEVRWRMRRLKYKHLAFLAESSTTYMQERESRELLAELLVHLERRWAEIEDGRTVVAMMMKVGHLSESLMNRLEDKVLGLRAFLPGNLGLFPWVTASGEGVWEGSPESFSLHYRPPKLPLVHNLERAWPATPKVWPV